MALIVDESAYPIIVVRFAETISEADWDEYLRLASKYVALEDGVVLVHDHLLGGTPNSTQRNHAAALFRDPRVKKAVRGSAIVTRSAIVRGAATAVIWLVKQPVPMKMFAALPEAIDWAKTLLPASNRKQA